MLSLDRKVHPVLVFLLGAAILLALNALRLGMAEKADGLRSDLRGLKAANALRAADLADLRALRDLKAGDLTKLKQGLSGMAQSKRTLYEAGLSLQEERRLLEKQNEIMTTYLQVDFAARKIRLMRGDLALQEFAIDVSSPARYGGAGKPLPSLLRIVSKERFAHPERGKSEEVDGKLQWVPPQVGTSVRSNALGEYVVFTDGGLILHGPPRREAEHKAFAHDCLNLSLFTARKLYSGTFIGTKIVFKK